MFEEPELLNSAHDNSVFDATNRTVCSKKTVIAEDNTDIVSNKSEPTNGDIMNRLYGIVSRLYTMDKRLNALEELKVQVTVFDNDLKKLWTFVEDKNTIIITEYKLHVLEDKVDTCECSQDKLYDEVVSFESDKQSLKGEIVYTYRTTLYYQTILNQRIEPMRSQRKN